METVVVAGEVSCGAINCPLRYSAPFLNMTMSVVGCAVAMTRCSGVYRRRFGEVGGAGSANVHGALRAVREA